MSTQAVSVPLFSCAALQSFFDTKNYSNTQLALTTIGTLSSLVHKCQNLFQLRWENRFDFGKMGNAMSDLAGYFCLADCLNQSYETYLMARKVITESSATAITGENRDPAVILNILVHAGKAFSDCAAFLETMEKTSVLTGLNIRLWKLTGAFAHAVYLIHSLWGDEDSAPATTDGQMPLKNVETNHWFQKERQKRLDTLNKHLTLSIVCIGIFGSLYALSGMSIPASVAIYGGNISFTLSVGSAICSIGSHLYGKQIEILKAGEVNPVLAPEGGNCVHKNR